MLHSAVFLMVRKSVSDICTLTEMEISNAEDVVQALKPMLVATNFMCEERTPTVSIISPLYTQLLSDMSSTAKDSPLIKELKNAIYQDLSKRYNSSEEKGNLYISSALDPRFKSLFLLLPCMRTCMRHLPKWCQGRLFLR